MSAVRPPRWPAVAFTAALLLIALLPWWRNHGYLRDLYDYGLVIAANGHLNLGERPYVDFTTPIQAGFLGLSWMFERLGGGTYGGLTLGGAALIDISRISPAFTHVWLKDGRMEKFVRKNLGGPERRENFRGWSAEPGGWLVGTTDYQENGPVITVRFDRLVHQNWP